MRISFAVKHLQKCLGQAVVPVTVICADILQYSSCNSDSHGNKSWSLLGPGIRQRGPGQIKDEVNLTKELAQTSQKQYNKVDASAYKLLCNLLAREPQTQWERIMQEMHNGDLWAGVNG